MIYFLALKSGQYIHSSKRVEVASSWDMTILTEYICTDSWCSGETFMQKNKGEHETCAKKRHGSKHSLAVFIEKHVIHNSSDLVFVA